MDTYKIVTDIVDGLVGHIAMEPVTHYVVEYINEEHGTKFESTNDLVEFVQQNNGEIWECDDCGWYTDCLNYCEECAMSVCDSCSEYEHDLK